MPSCSRRAPGYFTWFLVSRLHLPRAIVMRLHVRKSSVDILTPETAVTVNVRVTSFITRSANEALSPLRTSSQALFCRKLARGVMPQNIFLFWVYFSTVSPNISFCVYLSKPPQNLSPFWGAAGACGRWSLVTNLGQLGSRSSWAFKLLALCQGNNNKAKVATRMSKTCYRMQGGAIPLVIQNVGIQSS